jgi:hypothetical protein
VSVDELRQKFSSLVQPCLGQDGQTKLYNVIMNLEVRSATDVFAATMSGGAGA